MRFKSSVNRTPRESTKGETGESLWVWLQLKLISDVGIIGLPNAGKSTFLASVTAASPKIANYPFTTVKPTLGVVNLVANEFVLADIPGLIEGASNGTGLGHRFLKHIERCKVLLHLIDITDKNFIKNYHIIRQELSNYSSKLLSKREVICFNKIDLLSEKEMYKALQKIANNFSQQKYFTISGYNRAGVKNTLHYLSSILDQSDT